MLKELIGKLLPRKPVIVTREMTYEQRVRLAREETLAVRIEQMRLSEAWFSTGDEEARLRIEALERAQAIKLREIEGRYFGL